MDENGQMAEPHDYSDRVPYGSAYDVGNLAAQDALRTAAIVALDEALAAFADVSHSYEMSDSLRTTLMKSPGRSSHGMWSACLQIQRWSRNDSPRSIASDTSRSISSRTGA